MFRSLFFLWAFNISPTSCSVIFGKKALTNWMSSYLPAITSEDLLPFVKSVEINFLSLIWGRRRPTSSLILSFMKSDGSYLESSCALISVKKIVRFRLIFLSLTASTWAFDAASAAAFFCATVIPFVSMNVLGAVGFELGSNGTLRRWGSSSFFSLILYFSFNGLASMFSTGSGTPVYGLSFLGDGLMQAYCTWLNLGIFL